MSSANANVRLARAGGSQSWRAMRIEVKRRRGYTPHNGSEDFSSILECNERNLSDGNGKKDRFGILLSTC